MFRVDPSFRGISLNSVLALPSAKSLCDVRQTTMATNPGYSLGIAIKDDHKDIE